MESGLREPMNIVRIVVDRNTGVIVSADAGFKEWINAESLNHIDEYLSPEKGSSFFQELVTAVEQNPAYVIEALPKFEHGKIAHIACYGNTNAKPQNDSLPIILIPVPKNYSDESEFSSPPPQFFDVITDFLVVCTPDFIIQQANPAAQAVFGGGEKLEGRYCYKALRGQTHPCEDCPLLPTLEAGHVVPLEYYDDSVQEYLETRIYPRLESPGELHDFTILTRIVSERRRQEGEETQEKKLVALGRMASGLAHDFNNMLTIILGRVQLLKSRLGNSDSGESLATIEKAALDSTEIIQRLQDFTRQQDEDAGLSLETVDVNLLVEDVIQYAETRTDRLRRTEGIRIVVEKQLGEVPSIAGHPGRLRSALLNVILNAMEAMEIGGVLRIWTKQIGAEVEIGVTDTGVGMSREVREQMFDPFFTTKGAHGNGLGLAEVFGIVRQHDGKIRVNSSPGEGATVSLFFPVSGHDD